MKAQYSVAGKCEFMIEFDGHIAMSGSVYSTAEAINVRFTDGYVTPDMLRLVANALEAVAKKGGVLNQFEEWPNVYNEFVGEV